MENNKKQQMLKTMKILMAMKIQSKNQAASGVYDFWRNT